MSKLGLIINREYSSRVKKRSFFIITLFVPLIITGLTFLAMWLSIQEVKQVKVLVVDPGNLCDAKIFVGDNPNPPATFYFTQEDISLDAFEFDQEYQRYDLLLGVQKEVITNRGIKGLFRDEISPKAEYYIKDKIELRLEEYFALDHGLSLSEYRNIRQEFNFHIANIDPFKEDTSYAKGVGLFFSTLIFFFVLIYAVQVMRSVIEEKTSRIVEILVSSVKPIQLMMGKIIGIGLVGLTQFFIWILLVGLALVLMRTFVFQDMLDPANLANAIAPLDGSATNLLTSQSGMILKDSPLIDVVYNGIPWGTLLTLFVIYFIGGYLFYGGLFAVVGSAVDSETDSQQAGLPILLLVLFCFTIGVMVVFDPNGGMAVWFSQFPFASPFTILQRLAAGSLSTVELIFSVCLLFGSIFVILMGAAKVYRTGILMYGKKASWREIFRWLRY